MHSRDHLQIFRSLINVRDTNSKYQFKQSNFPLLEIKIEKSKFPCLEFNSFYL